MRYRFFFPALLLGAAFVAAGCDSHTLDEEVPPGALAFHFTGGLPGLLEGGAFETAGAPALDARGRPSLGEWAVAGRAPLFPKAKWVVVAADPRTARDGVVVAITLPRTAAPKTMPFTTDASVCPDGVACPQVLLLFGVDPRAPHDGVDGSCGLAEGTVTVTAVSADRLQGTFSGTGGCRFSNDEPFRPFSVSDGTFDVALSTTYDSGLSIY